MNMKRKRYSKAEKIGRLRASKRKKNTLNFNGKSDCLELLSKKNSARTFSIKYSVSFINISFIKPKRRRIKIAMRRRNNFKF